MNAVSVSISIDHVERMDVGEHVSAMDGRTWAFMEVDGMSIMGKNPEMFRRLASRCSEAAAILEAAKTQTAIEPLPLMTAAEVRANYESSAVDESGVA